jgi:hypothetical protein
MALLAHERVHMAQQSAAAADPAARKKPIGNEIQQSSAMQGWRVSATLPARSAMSCARGCSFSAGRRSSLPR